MSDIVKVALIAACGTAFSSIIGIVLLVMLKRMDVKVDGRLTQLLEANKQAARAEGHADGVKDERNR